MARVRGTGMAAVNYPRHEPWGDPSQALIPLHDDRDIRHLTGKRDLGQGSRPYRPDRRRDARPALENILIGHRRHRHRSHCMGHVCQPGHPPRGHAVMAAARELAR